MKLTKILSFLFLIYLGIRLRLALFTYFFMIMIYSLFSPKKAINYFGKLSKEIINLFK
jgi:hypothetical protein